MPPAYTLDDMIDLPEHLAPILSGHPHIDVLGSEDPWPIPDGWLEETQQRIRQLAEDPRTHTNAPLSADYKPGTSCAIPLFWNLATYLPSSIPLWAGTEVHLGDTLVGPWYSESYEPGSRVITYYSNSDHKWYLYLVWRLLEGDAATRLASIELTMKAIEVLDSVPHFTQRARTLTTLFQRALDDPASRRVHETGTWDDLIELWLGIATDAEAEIVPEVRGWTNQLAWSLAGFDAAHAQLTEMVSRGQTADEVIASMAIFDGVDELPAGLAAAAGAGRFMTINDAVERLRPGFDADDWLGDNRGWLARAMVTGEIDAVRLWLAMATQVALLNVGLPDFNTTTRCPDRFGYYTDLRSIFQAPAKVANPLAERLAERAARRKAAAAATSPDGDGPLRRAGRAAARAATRSSTSSSPRSRSATRWPSSTS